MTRPGTVRLALTCMPVALVAVIALSACDYIPRGSTQKNDLAALRTVTITVTGKKSYNAWVAETQDTQMLGLMNVTDAELTADRAMIFAFDRDEYRSFWMRNTIIPLDIAYIRSDGTIVKTYTMEPLNEIGYHSIEPARFALEVRAGQFAELGIKPGDHVEIPPDLLD
jgi:uncharacterized protein